MTASEHVDLRLADLSARVDELRSQVQRILTDVEQAGLCRSAEEHGGHDRRLTLPPPPPPLPRVLGTLANPHRLRVVAALTQERNYVSQLARELGISRALLQVHLRKLEAAGLVSADIEVPPTARQ